MKLFRTTLVLLLVLAAGAGPSAQEGDASTADDVRDTLATIETILDSRAAKSEAVAAKQAELDAAADREEEQRLEGELAELRAELARLDSSLESVATGIDVDAFDGAERHGFELRSELEELIRPLVQELKEATEEPRQIEQLRMEQAFHTQREAVAVAARESVRSLLDAAEAGEARSRLRTILDGWDLRIREIQNDKKVAEFRLDARMRGRKSLLQSTRTVFQSFFRTRGLNVLLSLGTFFGLLVGMRLLGRLLSKLLRGSRRKERPFYARLLDVIFGLFTGFIALAGALLVLYVAGDWVLLGLALLLLFGVAWAGKNSLPHVFEQVRLLLNLGSVREHERVIYDGLPWRVSRLSVYTLLANPDLVGGVLRLPIRDLVGMTSRPYSEKEPWFPCRIKNWVILSDGKRGEVLVQSPEFVRIRLLGGSKVTYRTADFLALNPELLSDTFRVGVPFGIDYSHQAISTTDVPRIMEESVRAGLIEMVGEDHLVKISVEFQQAGASSLDYLIQADLHGDEAADYDKLQRAIQSMLVDVCNREGWVIPFTQITLHEAGAS